MHDRSGNRHAGVVGALFPSHWARQGSKLVNPIGNTPDFLEATRGLSEHGRSALARMVALNSLMLILASIFIGTITARRGRGGPAADELGRPTGLHYGDLAQFSSEK